ncbi:MAG: XdhC family protein [Burkholderiales bacterium]|nr:XdhC family protein [Burkholderiales bacterium]
MDSVDLNVLKSVLAWRRAGQSVNLVTVIETWGSAPRPPGALLAIRGDGQIVGSVSGGCVEDDLIERCRNAPLLDRPQVVSYGVTTEEAARFGLPCGGALKLVQEPVTDTAWVEDILGRAERHELALRSVDIETGRVTIGPASRADKTAFDGRVLKVIYGPLWRMLIIGAGQLSRYLAEMAQALDYQVIVCDPREEYRADWNVPGAELVTGMPDDVVVQLNLDAHSAVVAVTHDPKLDDMALLEALKSPAFYVGALGSRVNTAKRKARLKEFDLSDAEIDRLHGPIGLRIGSRTPPEIAVSILAEVTAVKNRFPLAKVSDKATGNFEAQAG